MPPLVPLNRARGGATLCACQEWCVHIIAAASSTRLLLCVLCATPRSPQHNTHRLCMGYVPGIIRQHCYNSSCCHRPSHATHPVAGSRSVESCGVCSNARSGARHEVGWPWVNIISRSNVIVAWLLCTYSRDGNHSLRVVWEGVKRRSRAAAVIGYHTPHARWLGASRWSVLTPHARWLGASRWSVLECWERSPVRSGLTVSASPDNRQEKCPQKKFKYRKKCALKKVP